MQVNVRPIQTLTLYTEKIPSVPTRRFTTRITLHMAQIRLLSVISHLTSVVRAQKKLTIVASKQVIPFCFYLKIPHQFPFPIIPLLAQML